MPQNLLMRLKTRPLADCLWSGLLLATVFAVIFWAEAGQDGWIALGVSPMPTLFADWAAVLAAGEAWANDADPWAIPNPFDPYGRPHVYGPPWLLLGHLGLTVGDTWWGGTLIVIAFVLVVARLAQVHDWKSYLVCALVLLSAPMLLAMNRANNDLLIFLLVAASAWASGRKETAFHWLALLGLMAAALLKFYPAIALIAIMAMQGTYRTRILQASVACVFTAFLAWHQFEEINRSLNVVPSPSSWWAYDGKAALRLLWDVVSSETRPNLLMGASIAFPMAICIWIASKDWWRFLPAQSSKSLIVVASALCWIGCLFAGSSFVYRAIWLIPIFVCFTLESKVPIKSRISGGSVFVILLAATGQKQALLINYTSEGNKENAGRLLFAHGVEQATLIATALICIIILLGWSWRLLRQTQLAAIIPARARQVIKSTQQSLTEN